MYGPDVSTTAPGSCDYWLGGCAGAATAVPLYPFTQQTCRAPVCFLFSCAKGFCVMKELEEKIRAEGQVYPGNILKVGSFLNHQIDTDFLMRMGAEIARLYEGAGVNKILTIEASGIAIAVAAASQLHVPMVFAKKSKSQNIAGDVYVAQVYCSMFWLPPEPV